MRSVADRHKTDYYYYFDAQVTNPGGTAFADYQKTELAKWGKAVQDAGVKID
jgi:hypothetical protein